MEVMVGLDAKFLYSETASTHMHTLKVAVFDMSNVPGGYSYDEITDLFGHRLNRLPPFRRRAVPVPWGLGHPVWVEDPDFDLKRHITRRRAAEPGGDHALAAVVADVAGRPLPRDRPLWEIVVVEGLADRRLAVVAKVHHAVADGAATVALLLNALSAHGADSHVDEWHPEIIPTRSQLLPWPPTATGHACGSCPAWRRGRSGGCASPKPNGAPHRSSHHCRSTRRRPCSTCRSPRSGPIAMTTLALEDLKAVRRARGATLNDVYLAMCGGALRTYLAEVGALPDRPLVASVPVSTDPSVTRLGGNHVDNLYVSIGTDIADPLERLRHIHDVSAASKDARAVLGNDLLEKRADVVPPQLYALIVRTWGRTRLANHMRPPVNLVLSNVAGPRQRLHVGQAMLEAIYSVGPILEGIGLNITAWSYADALHVSVLGCPTSVPDPWLIAQALHGALADIKEASDTAAGSVPVDG